MADRMTPGEPPMIYVGRQGDGWRVLVRPTPTIVGVVDQAVETAGDAAAYAAALSRRFGWRVTVPRQIVRRHEGVA